MPFATLKQILDDFPKYASSIARRVSITPQLADEVLSNALKAQQGINAVWLNGAVVSDTDMSPFGCVLYLINFFASAGN
jgi:UDP-glucose:glycoprotein glucosyltransferase